MRIRNDRTTMDGIKRAQQERQTQRVKVYGKNRGLTLLRLQPKSAKKL